MNNNDYQIVPESKWDMFADAFQSAFGPRFDEDAMPSLILMSDRRAIIIYGNDAPVEGTTVVLERGIEDPDEWFWVEQVQ